LLARPGLRLRRERTSFLLILIAFPQGLQSVFSAGFEDLSERQVRRLWKNGF
jgi:hypothetical protein